ncbi:fibropellin-3-like [Mercenaria mercenaria]|uniref:fibropellin-3-like n=1 Tax=Mercenaria mercenaria TaxID=6596 RepID=UPI00234F4748|nr:fibropellin-3-like [Mercenaria mercenaria]
MGLSVISTFLVVVLLGAEIADTRGFSKRFLYENLIPTTVKWHECVLCKCYQECNAGVYQLSEKAICQDFWDSIKCSGVLQVIQPTDFCASYPCLNGAVCTSKTNGYSCQCTSGWTGQNCGTDIDECVSNSPCRNAAVCTNTQGHYSCGCTSGWTGLQCEIDVNECVTSPCSNGGTCFNKQGGFHCVCADGFGGQTCDIGTLPVCSHTCFLETVVKAQPVESNNTDTCPGTSNKATNEALLMQCCNIGRSNRWHKGVQVIQHCKDNTIPSYTPVAAVVNGKLLQDTAGVFTSCLNNASGFKMILQKCNTVPELIQINGTDGNNPENYFVMY